MGLFWMGGRHRVLEKIELFGVFGYTVNADGAWVSNGVVQTKAATGTGTTNTAAANGNYDPAHPLANVVDAWNLRIVPPSTEVPGGKNWTYPIGDWMNVHAMLTNQMEQYHMNTAGWSINSVTGDRVWTEQSDIDRSVAREQVLYNWFCNWLNSMDFQNMSEMQKAQEIKKVLLQARYDQTYSREGTYSILIDKSGACSDFAAAAISMAKALGLKCQSTGGRGHEYYYI